MIVGVTGAKGFVGENVCQYLMERGVEVEAFVGDVRSFEDVDKFVRDVDFVVHLARKNKDVDQILLETNVMGTHNVAVACSQRFVRSVCVNSDYPHKSAYKAGNQIGENIVMSINQNMDGRNSLLVLPRLYGPGCKPSYNSFVSTLLYSIAKKQDYEHMIDDPKSVISLLHVDDVCREIESLIKANTYYTYSRLVPTESYTIEKIIEMANGEDNIFAELVEWYSTNM